MNEEKQKIQDLAERIEACDRSQPYMYVSYSTRDGSAVYECVQALREAGCNLWIDIPVNFNTGEGYNTTIFDAISDNNCRGILFFISAQSFTSAQSAKEVAYIRSDSVLANHGEALPVIGVELERVKDHDLKLWVETELNQSFADELLSPAESERIEKYRMKYNGKINRMGSKYDLAQLISQELEKTKFALVAFDAERIPAVKAACTELLK